MSHHNTRDAGFTIAELVIVVSILGLVVVIFANFFSDNYSSFIQLQTTTVRENALSSASQRVARVIRGMNTITDIGNTTITGYVYFTPADATLSKVHYYYDSGSRSVKVGVIPATGSAPNYTYSSANERVTTIAEHIDASSPIFTYLDSSGQSAQFSADTYKDIKGIGIRLKSDKIGGYTSPFDIKTSVTLRNRKTNL